jgi:hypothetical protein
VAIKAAMQAQVTGFLVNTIFSLRNISALRSENARQEFQHAIYVVTSGGEVLDQDQLPGA